MFNNKLVGKKGEEIAAKFLQEHGYKIVERNWGSKWGEVDIICKLQINTNKYKCPIFVFVEVKTKVGEDWGAPEEMINKKKLLQVQRMAETYEPARGHQSRIDVVAVVLDDDLSIKRLNHYECVY